MRVGNRVLEAERADERNLDALATAHRSATPADAEHGWHWGACSVQLDAAVRNPAELEVAEHDR